MSSESSRPRRHRSAHATLSAHGEPWVWITAGSLALTIVMIVGLLAFIAVRGAATFWPVPLELVQLADGQVLGRMASRTRAAAFLACGCRVGVRFSGERHRSALRSGNVDKIKLVAFERMHAGICRSGRTNR